jgi:hypothetical protein
VAKEQYVSALLGMALLQDGTGVAGKLMAKKPSYASEERVCSVDLTIGWDL